jgi:plasmid stabilization system protein ParE
MTYRVIITGRAEREMQDAARWWAANRSAEQASRWLAGLEKELQTLTDAPVRCPRASEHELFSFEIRELHYGLGRRVTHRAVFTVRDEQVFVLTIRHAAQDKLQPEDLA